VMTMVRGSHLVLLVMLVMLVMLAMLDAIK
jgi:hypothetical protein